MSRVNLYSALSAANEAILRTKTQDDLFQRVCDAAVHDGGIRTAFAFVPESDGWLTMVASAAHADSKRKPGLRVSVDPSSERGNGLAGIAFRSGRPCVSNDYQNDPRMKPWLNERRGEGVGAAAAVPIMRDGRSVGVLMFFVAEPGSLTDDVIALLKRIAENTAFGLASFDREAENASVSRMYAALSATNEAIMRAETREEMYQLVCEAAVNGAKFTSTTIGMADPNSDFFQIMASAGPNASRLREIKLSPRADLPEGQGLSGTAFRTGVPAIANDYRNDPRGANWRSAPSGSQSGAGMPLIVAGKVAGFMLFMSKEKNTFTEAFVDLLQRLCENVAFALENFDRRDDAKRAEEHIRYLATHDPLTALPNRTMFNELLGDFIARAERNSENFAVLFIDLDRFKVINDSLGHAAGDDLLKEISTRLRGRLRESDVVCRLGGDEFVVLLDKVGTREAAGAIAQDLLRLINEPLNLCGHHWRTSASIGIAIYPTDGVDGSALTTSADVAMYSAKGDGKNDFRFHGAESQTESIHRLTLESGLREALENNQFFLQYQPKIDVVTGRVNGVEALIRWKHPELGLIAPGTFIGLAEETGLIIPIGQWVLRSACAQAVAWRESGAPAISMAVNLSPRQFADANLLHDIDRVIAETGMDAGLLQLEITESTVMQNVQRAAHLLEAIRSRGVHLAIDDFGTGYSSLSLMKTFPIDTIKLDRSFIKDVPLRKQDMAIANAIIAMGKALGMTVVAEGVETSEQESFLRANLCDEIQGFLYSKPRDPDDIPALLDLTLLPSGSPALVPMVPACEPESERLTSNNLPIDRRRLFAR